MDKDMAPAVTDKDKKQTSGIVAPAPTCDEVEIIEANESYIPSASTVTDKDKKPTSGIVAPAPTCDEVEIIEANESYIPSASTVTDKDRAPAVTEKDKKPTSSTGSAALVLERLKQRIRAKPASSETLSSGVSRFPTSEGSLSNIRRLGTPDSGSSSAASSARNVRKQRSKGDMLNLSTKRLLDLATMPPSGAAVANSDDLMILVAAGMFRALHNVRMLKFALKCLPRGASDHSVILKSFLKIYFEEHAGLLAKHEEHDAIVEKVVIVHMQTHVPAVA
jgi:hypothetical protein